MYHLGIRDSSVGIATGCGLDVRHSFLGRTRNFSILHSFQTGSGAHPASYPMGTEGSFPGVKRPGREADRSPTSNAEVKNGGAIPALPRTSSCSSAYVIKHKDNFTLYTASADTYQCHLHNDSVQESSVPPLLCGRIDLCDNGNNEQRKN
jgi:hypothetical protein